MKTGSEIYLKMCPLVVIWTVLALSVLHPDIACGKITRVAIMPLNIEAEDDLSFLKDGIHSMLMSRLSWVGNVKVLEREEINAIMDKIEIPANETLYRNVGDQLAADYIIYGNIAVVMNRLSIDIKVVDMKHDVPERTFSEQSQDMDEVVNKIDHLTDEINEKVFGRIPSLDRVSSKTASDSSIYAHPDRLVESLPK